MENEKQNDKKTIKTRRIKLILGIIQSVCIGLTLFLYGIIGLAVIGGLQSIDQRLEDMQKYNNKDESALAREEVRRALPLRDSVADLTNTTWVFNDNLASGVGLTRNINFASNEENFTSLNSNQDDGIIYMFYNWNNGANYLNACYGTLDDDVGSTYWNNQAYRTIVINGGADVTNSNLISWLETNAVLQNEPDPDIPVQTGGITFSLPSRYDFRKWLGEVDPLTGCFRYTTSGTTRKVFDLGSVVVSGKTYTTLQISTLAVNNAINIITGYDFQNQCYLAMGGGDYYNNGSGYSLITGIWLTNVTSGDAPLTDKLTLYECPLVGARLQYESGNPISPTDYVSATGLLCSTFELKQTAINWENYLPSSTTYTFPGLGDDLSVYDVLQLDLLNDTYLDFYSISASATGGNVFDLIGNAFKVITNLASIQVIPGISLGLLVVLPITATIIIVVIKLVRK